MTDMDNKVMKAGGDAIPVINTKKGLTLVRGSWPEFRDCAEAIDTCVRLAKIYTPDPEKHKIYEQAFQVWSEAYMTVNGTFYKQA